MKSATAWRLLALLVLVGASAAALILLPVRGLLSDLVDWVGELGPWGPVALAVIYVPACVFLVPGSLLTVAAGFLFGVVVGTIAVSLGSVAGASAAFLVGRFLARRWVESRVAASPRFRAIDEAVAEKGFQLVLLTRLSPVFPFTLLNYAFGLTRVRFRDYLLASWIGMLPGTLMYVYIGSVAKSLAELATDPSGDSIGPKILSGVGLVMTVAVVIYTGRVAKKALDTSLTRTEPDA